MSKIANLLATAETVGRPAVIALHCSGANGSEWQQLGCDLGHRVSLIAPNLIGNGGTEGWSGEHAFTLSDEAAKIVSIIDAVKGPVHLVGHSYGGCVALRCAVERPTRVASLALYEPAAFHVLKTMGPDGRAGFEDISAVAREVNQFVWTGAYHAAAERFVDYWSGQGTWAAMRPEARDALVRYMPKAGLEFSAGSSEPMPLAAYRRFNFPVLLLQGQHTYQPMRLIARQLAKAMRPASLQTLYGAGHMGPFSHAAAVSEMIAGHIEKAEARLPRSEDEFRPGINRAA